MRCPSCEQYVKNGRCAPWCSAQSGTDESEELTDLRASLARSEEERGRLRLLLVQAQDRVWQARHTHPDVVCRQMLAQLEADILAALTPTPTAPEGSETKA